MQSIFNDKTVLKKQLRNASHCYPGAFWKFDETKKGMNKFIKAPLLVEKLNVAWKIVPGPSVVINN